MGDNAIDATELRAYIERVERLTEEKKALSDDIREVYAEAKGSGFNPKYMRLAVRERAKDAAKRDEERLEGETYLAALGLL